MLTRLFTFRASLRFLLPTTAFLFSAIAGISVAAWLDAPNAPPNYGLTPPFTQDDFRPMNLGTSPQTKRGSIVVVGTLIATSTTPTSFPNFPGNIVASGFYDSEDTAYFLDPAEQSAYAGVFGGKVGIRQRYPAASLAVNNGGEVSGKTGSLTDAIYAYANNATGAALSAEQINSAGYAIYASGGINYFGGEVRVGSAADPKNLCLNDDCKSTWPSISGGIANYLTKWTGATALGNSVIHDDGTNVGIGTDSPQTKLEVGNGGSLRVSAGLILYNTDGPYSGCTAGAPTIPDPTGNSCTCKSGLKTLGQLGGSPTCTYNSFMSGGNNFASCVYSCTLSGAPISTYKSADINLDGLGKPQISPSLGYNSTNFGGMYYAACMNAGDENPYTGSCSCPPGFSTHQFGGFNSLAFCYR